MSQGEFCERTALPNDLQFVQWMESTLSERMEQGKEKQLRFYLGYLRKVQQDSQSLDLPSKSFIVQFRKEHSQKLKLKSEHVFLCICSDQQDYLFQQLFPGKSTSNPPSLEEM